MAHPEKGLNLQNYCASLPLNLVKYNAMRSQSLVLLLISFFFIKSARSQSYELLIQGQTGKLYLEHTVVAKENWYSIGRLYNVSPKEVAPFNNLTMAQSLNIGQQLQIPLTATNFSQNGVKTPAETLVPLYHIIQEKEWMYRISVNHNKVPIASLEKWNNINKDQVKAGMHLIVGYLKVKTALSALAANGGAPSVAGAAGSTPAGTPAANTPPVTGAKTSTTAAGTPLVTTSKTSIAGTPSGTNSKTSTAGTPPAAPAAAPKVATPPVITATISNSQPAAKEDPPPAKEETKVVTHPNAPATTASASTTATPALHFNGGYFKTDFADGGKSMNGQAGIFKSTSGWQDGKYYALMNNVAVGTIVKINAPSGKSIYAKILGQLPDMKESAGLTVRISNAAASELGEGEGRFTVEVRY
jgi:LysM repeat protein